MLGSRDRVKVRRKGLEIRVLGELSLALKEVALCFGLKMDLGGTEWIVFGDEVILVHSF